MQRPVSLFALALLAAVTVTVRAQNEGFNLDLGANEQSNLSLDEIDEFDKGPSSGPFSNKPGWPNLDGPWDEEDGTPAPSSPAPTPAPSSPAPTPAPSSPTMSPSPTTTPIGANNGNKNTLAPATPSVAPAPSVTPASSTPAPYSSATDKPKTPAPMRGPSLLGEAEHIGNMEKIDYQKAENAGADGPQCPQDAISVSVEGTPGAHCVSTLKPFCSREHPTGNCPGPQNGLENGSHCGIVKSGANGCLPGPATTATGPVKCDADA
ncbi:hypothetical protein PybrP1_003144 [[Pythium] brassicae (nom. inval.)]|nr:hypothetical protein PybrP1_003144 [[Pythium] brassicae (nom. inval.)]